MFTNSLEGYPHSAKPSVIRNVQTPTIWCSHLTKRRTPTMFPMEGNMGGNKANVAFVAHKKDKFRSALRSARFLGEILINYPVARDG